MLQDQQSGHQTHRQGRLADPTGIDPAQRAFQERPIDPPGQLHQRVPKVDDLLQGRSEQILLPLIPGHRHCKSPVSPQEESNQNSSKIGI